MSFEQIGRYAFIIGVIIALVAGIVAALNYLDDNMKGYVVLVLVIIGIIVGFLNISEKEEASFLISAIALLAAGAANLGVLPLIGPFLGPILTYISVMIAPAVVIVALVNVYHIAKKK